MEGEFQTSGAVFDLVKTEEEVRATTTVLIFNSKSHPKNENCNVGRAFGIGSKRSWI
jgi:hypothetical protein